MNNIIGGITVDSVYYYVSITKNSLTSVNSSIYQYLIAIVKKTSTVARSQRIKNFKEFFNFTHT